MKKIGAYGILWGFISPFSIKKFINILKNNLKNLNFIYDYYSHIDIIYN